MKIGISMWEKFLLLFKKSYVGIDYSEGPDKSAWAAVKCMGGKYYIIDSGIFGDNR